MNNNLLNTEIQDFINENINADLTKLALMKNPFTEVNWLEILNQIAAKKKAKTKLPSYFATENIIYPSKISVEQTSSEKTAQYKSEIVSGNSLIDLTGGFGVDDYFFSNKIKQVIHCEINTELSAIAKHNFEQLKVTNIECIAGDGTAILTRLNQQFDWIYIDPSRRNDVKGKVFMLKDCLPNVPELLDFYFQFTDKILIKTAPILDITAGLQELKSVKAIHIIAVENEVKELLWEMENKVINKKIVNSVNISKKVSIFASDIKDSNPIPTFSFPKKYLYEPNAAIMKAGAFNQITNYFKLDKLHQHSHLYTSDDEVDFFGRIFVIAKCFEYNKSEMKINLEGKKANITVRNFNESVENIRKKWKIQDGGDTYCFFTTNLNNQKIVLICNQILKK